MKKITIYKREILQRTGYKKHPYKQAQEISIIYNDKEYKNHLQDIKSPSLKIKFMKVLETQSNKKLNDYLALLDNRNPVNRWIKSIIDEIIK